MRPTGSPHTPHRGRGLLLAACLVLLAAAPAATPTPDPPAIRVGAAAPDFTLRASDGSEHRLAEARGASLVLIFFRGTW